MVAPIPMGVYYSMTVYQRQFCHPGPMVGFPVAHAIPGATPSPGSIAEHSPFGGQSPVLPNGSGPHSPNDATMLNPRSHVFHPAMPPNGEGMGHYLYQDPRYFSYAGAPHPMAPPMVSPPVPLPSGYPMPPYDWTAYADHGTNAPPRRGSGPHRRRKPSSQPRSSTSSSVATSGGPDSRDSVPEIIPPVASPDVHLVATETLPAGSTSDSPSQSLSGATSVNQVHGTRSNFVMWCGNVPSDATLDELWSFFSTIPSLSSEAEASNTPGLSHGILSIFIISRSSCAFVNYESQEHLDQACTHFQGKQLRAKTNCPRLVCRPRKLEDAEYAGVAAQRGKGVHANWYRQQRKLIQEVRDQATQDDTEPADDSDANSIRSFSSTNSSLLRQPLFAHRFFILKSRSRDALVTALTTHLWSTQPHNEPVLDQAFRNSEVVTLFFSENFSGQFFGYANMTSSPGSTQTVSDPVEDLLASQSLDDTCHPSTMASSDEHTDKTHCASPTLSLCSSVSATPSVRAEHQLHVDLSTSAKRHNQSLEDNSFSGDSPAMIKEPIMTNPENKDAPTSQSETSIHESRTLQVGRPFSLDWKITQPLPFSEIHNLRNPWRDNRLIKVSRDGTELEPNVGRQLMSVWESYLARQK
ncbi:hypothetical protein MEQU1_003528 [Malassezia equina]|uniref:YTH domain-containing protein n=1 Tax=Malassezia equina TaxID=1381935 RepID=A0AAF0EG01_9BASI|nr:hypothetical protein MEQU1_003528 [Malassezia equina]